MAILSELLKETLEKLQNKQIKRTKQISEDATYAPMINKELGCIDWSKSAVDIHNLIRGLNSWPLGYTLYNGNKMKYMNTLKGGDPHIFKTSEMTDKDLYWYRYPSDEDMEKSELRIVYLGYFMDNFLFG